MNKKKNEFHRKRENLLNQSLPCASAEELRMLEDKIMEVCSIYMPTIESLTEKQLGALLQRMLSFDLQRGLLPGQIPNRQYQHSRQFEEWEKTLWERIERRLETVSDVFFKL